MEKLKQSLNSAVKAFDALEKILDVPKSIVNEYDDILGVPLSEIIRDSTIQRFESAHDTLWKAIKDYLDEYEGIISNSPKGCIKEAFAVKLLIEEETRKLLEMTDDRNMTSHRYKEEIATIIYGKISKHIETIQKALNSIKAKTVNKERIEEVTRQHKQEQHNIKTKQHQNNEQPQKQTHHRGWHL